MEQAEVIEQPKPLVVRQQSTELTVDQVIGRLEGIQDLMKRAMTMGTDFGVIPGTKSKPTLLKPGAEKLCMMFRLSPAFTTIKSFEDKHLTVESTCRISNHQGDFLGEASAMASTKEAKYAYRKAERVCPECGAAAIIKGRAEYGGGWLCWNKPEKGKNGCGAKFPDKDARIVEQAADRVENDDLADSYNTVLRIAEKRAYIAAVRVVTGSSALFDEDPGFEGEKADPHFPDAEKKLKQAPTLDALAEVWKDLTKDERSALLSVKDKRKKELTHA